MILNTLINECEQIIKLNNKDKDILHITNQIIFFDDNIKNDLKKISKKADNVVIRN